jgi:hypothetical protein
VSEDVRLKCGHLLNVSCDGPYSHPGRSRSPGSTHTTISRGSAADSLVRPLRCAGCRFDSGLDCAPHRHYRCLEGDQCFWHDHRPPPEPR